MTTNQPKAAKGKSPSVPSYSLKDSLDDARKLYDAFSHAGFSRTEIATKLDMSSASSSFSKRLFALTEYGLIQGTGDSYKIAERFHALTANPSTSPAFKRAAYDAIVASDVFGELLTEFKSKLPDKATVAKRLETQKKFLADRAKEVAGVLERSLQFAGLLDGNNNIIPIRDEQNGASTAAPQTREDDRIGNGEEVSPDRADGRAEKLRRTEVPLSNDRIAVVAYPHDLTEAEATKIGKVLGALVG